MFDKVLFHKNNEFRAAAGISAAKSFRYFINIPRRTKQPPPLFLLAATRKSELFRIFAFPRGEEY